MREEKQRKKSRKKETESESGSDYEKLGKHQTDEKNKCIFLPKAGVDLSKAGVDLQLIFIKKSEFLLFSQVGVRRRRF